MKVQGRGSAVFALALAFAFAVAPERLGAQRDDVTVIEGGTLIDGTGRAPLPSAVIVVEGNRIKAVGARGSVEIPAGAKKIDATGKWILPGLIESHGHYREYEPELLINYGITTDIDTGNYMEYILAVREATAAGKLWGPRIFSTGAGITGAGGGANRDRMIVHNAAEARAAAEEHVRRKLDFIKVYEGITAEELAGVTEVAHRAGLKVVGHLRLTDAREATMVGIDGLIHAGGISAALVPESEEKVIKATTGRNPWGTPGGGVFHYQMDESKFDDLIRLLLERHVMVEPDLVHSAKGIIKQWDRFDLENRRLLMDNPNLAYVPREAAQRWFSTSFLNEATPEELERRRIGYEKMTRFLKKFVSAGGVLLAGSDFVGDAAPGTTLHQEMEVFVEDVGLTPMQAIQTATRDTAEFYLQGKGLGTIETGKLADLIVVKGDPLRDIRNTRKIELVMKDGRLMTLGYHASYTNPYHRPFPDEGGIPAPMAILSITPYVLTQGDRNTVLTIKGTGFKTGSFAQLAAQPLKTNYVSPTELTADVPEVLLQAVGTFPVRIVFKSYVSTELSGPAFVMVKYAP